ncbi:hypothetical protein FRC08_009474 [Ceratobasidium sp. 394]|nr:hypothetical protein FRC08_009474 [Ceratobasidium sp. 394]
MADNLLPLGDLRDEILEAAASCKLLLLVGVSLKCPETFGLIYDLSSKVHEQSGAVVLVDPKPTKGRNTSHCIDFHLKVEIEDFSAQTLVAMNFKRQSPAGDVETLSPAKSESRNQWYEVSASRGATAATLSPRSTTSGQVMGNNVQSEISVEDCQPTEPMCCLCNITVTECLLQCTECGDYLCYPGKFNPEGRIRSCIVALKHPGERDGRYTKPAADNFVCPWCWKHSERGVYPHYVRPASQWNVQPRREAAPRMAMVIYYLDRFWPQAKHLCSLVAGHWSLYGWPARPTAPQCVVEPRKLEQLSPNEEILERCTWESDTFDLFVVYITHGRSEPPAYHTSQDRSLMAPEFFDYTLGPAQSVIRRARYTCGFLICSGDAFRSAKHTREVQEWMNCRHGPLDTLIGCLNPKLAPAFMINMVARITTGVAGFGESGRYIILDSWLSDGVACNHSDLIYMAARERPLVWLFSPFNSRPLGKELPHLLSVCSCQSSRGPDSEQTPRRARKVWIVSHKESADRKLRNVQLKARCSVCNQAWILPTEHMDGCLYTHGGLYAALVPYFAL